MAQVDFFMKFDGIEGESQDSKHKGDLDIESFSFGVSNASSVGTGGGSGAGRAEFHEFSFVANLSKASPKLKLACIEGTHIKEVTLFVRKAGGEQNDFLTFKMNDVMVTHYHVGASELHPTEQVQLSYGEIEMEYKEQDSTGKTGKPVKIGYHLGKRAKK